MSKYLSICIHQVIPCVLREIFDEDDIVHAFTMLQFLEESVAHIPILWKWMTTLFLEFVMLHTHCSSLLHWTSEVCAWLFLIASEAPFVGWLSCFVCATSWCWLFSFSLGECCGFKYVVRKNKHQSFSSFVCNWLCFLLKVFDEVSSLIKSHLHSLFHDFFDGH